MKKQIKICLFILFFLIVTIPSKVFAEEVTCSKVYETYDLYKRYEADYNSFNCDNLVSTNSATNCTNSSLNKNYYLQLLYEYNDEKPECISEEIKEVIDNNSDKCSSVFSTDIKEVSSTIMKLFYIIAPFLLILFGSVDFFKIVSASDAPAVIKKSKKDFTIRIVSFLLIFTLPAFINFVLSFISSENKLDGPVYVCESDYYYFQERYSSHYIENKISTGSSLSGRFNNNFTIRDTIPTINDKIYYDDGVIHGNTGQCVWYARSRAMEIVTEMGTNGTLTQNEVDTILDRFAKNTDHAKNYVDVGKRMKVKTSTNIEDIVAPSIIVWYSEPHGHVGIIEYADENSVILSDGFSSPDTESCDQDWSCVNVLITTYSRDEFMTGRGLYDDGTKTFAGYVYFTELEGE